MTETNLPKKHPAYGAITVTRTSQGGKGKALFRSPFRHGHYITLRIHAAELERSYGRDWHHGENKSYIEVALSETQFSQLLSSHSIGEGVPCTICYLGNERIEDPPFDEVRARHENEFDEKLKELHRSVKDAEKEINEIMDQKSIKVSDRQRVKSLIYHISMDLTKNLPFLLEQYVEKIREVTDSAENEIRAGLVARLQELGMNKLMEDNMIESPIEVKLLANKEEMSDE